MVYTLLAFFTNVYARTLIVPITLKTHRLTLNDASGAPILINSALHDDTVNSDKIRIPSDFAFLSDTNHSVCYNLENDSLSVCKNEGERQPWHLLDEVRNVRFSTSDNKCLTVGERDDATDNYSLNLLPCDMKNKEQVFILNKNHGMIKDAKSMKELRKKMVEIDVEEKDGYKPRKLEGDGNYDKDNNVETAVQDMLNRRQNSGNPHNDQTKPYKLTQSDTSGHIPQ
ncbi:hypothetical protein EHP00_163 [Ecytonucleospora hepatopenaei]|uniref:Uncharacterized protein n=1 Tax=Ecytonucleospora hepatopenaei TaxID=646526 RepID=A0A1W0E6F7_9MICR|nr:hypothetical protein EHP00_163 [Ecytonucleospora hepatopenaei]